VKICRPAARARLADALAQELKRRRLRSQRDATKNRDGHHIKWRKTNRHSPTSVVDIMATADNAKKRRPGEKSKLADRQVPPNSERTREHGIAAHIDAGKTTITEALSFTTGMIHQDGEK